MKEIYIIQSLTLITLQLNTIRWKKKKKLNNFDSKQRNATLPQTKTGKHQWGQNSCNVVAILIRCTVAAFPKLSAKIVLFLFHKHCVDIIKLLYSGHVETTNYRATWRQTAELAFVFWKWENDSRKKLGFNVVEHPSFLM